MAYNSRYSITNVFRRYDGISTYSIIPGITPYTAYDLEVNRELATRYYKQLLRLKYGDGYDFILWGPGVDSVGRLTYDIARLFNDALYGDAAYIESATLNPASVDSAFAYIENTVFVTLLKKEVPHYEYPWYYELRIAPYSTIDRFEFNPKQIQSLKYLGSKLTGTAINVDSSQTSDGGPVVKVTKVNQNQIVFSNNNITTARANVSGLPVRQLTARTGTTSGRTSQGTSSQTGGIISEPIPPNFD